MKKNSRKEFLRNTVHLIDQMTRQETSIFGRTFFVNGGCLTVSIWREVSAFIKIEGR
jgi:hypothetical protein